MTAIRRAIIDEDAGEMALTSAVGMRTLWPDGARNGKSVSLALARTIEE